ncbi:hypothetical protein EON63_20000 [archaeon]|nr:MAG: hypothetical protein EON63_20000 [archaeon]
MYWHVFRIIHITHTPHLPTPPGTLLKGALSRNGAGWGVFEDCLAHDKPRPLLVILERGSDFFPMVQHNNSYLVWIMDYVNGACLCIGV